MKKILFLITIVFISNQLFAQTENFAKAGETGIFVHLGLDIPNATNTSFYLIERKTEDGEWKSITKLKFPETFKEFNDDYYKFKELFPYIREEPNLRNIYNQLKGTTSIKDKTFPHKADLLSIRLAARNVFYDQNVDKHVKYQYRITDFYTDGD
ncbi:MAG TPA: hypothetical protein ENK91_16410, partial [Bacteroidetes bacterium]|nr:hypothetical protein [Bacteroidota bacterium]